MAKRQRCRPKTEHHPGRATRQIPLFPELLPYLREVFEQAKPGTERVITCFDSVKKNMRTRMTRIIRRAGLEPWPKLFQNLRSTRETELAEKYPLHVVCAWIGNSEPIAAKHYLQVTDAHFESAAAKTNGSPEPEVTADGLIELATAWPSLTEGVRSQILDLIEANRIALR